MIDPRVRTFLAVCEAMSYTRAAENLHLSQPAVSQQVHSLEREYGTQLLRYEGRHLELTPAGLVVEEAATTVRNDDALLRSQIASDAAGEVPLRFGATMSIAEVAVASPLARILASHPHAEVRMEMGNTQSLLGHIRAGELNFALVEGYVDEREFDSAPFSAEKFVPVCAPGHVFATDGDAGSYPRQLADLLGEVLITREEGSGTREVLERQLAARGLGIDRFARHVEVGGMQTILGLVEQDAGIAFLYERVAMMRISAGTLRVVDLADFSVTHDFSMVWERGSVYAPIYRSLCEEFARG